MTATAVTLKIGHLIPTESKSLSPLNLKSEQSLMCPKYDGWMTGSVFPDINLLRHF